MTFEWANLGERGTSIRPSVFNDRYLKWADADDPYLAAAFRGGGPVRSSASSRSVKAPAARSMATDAEAADLERLRRQVRTQRVTDDDDDLILARLRVRVQRRDSNAERAT